MQSCKIEAVETSYGKVLRSTVTCEELIVWSGNMTVTTSNLQNYGDFIMDAVKSKPALHGHSMETNFELRFDYLFCVESQCETLFERLTPSSREQIIKTILAGETCGIICQREEAYFYSVDADTYTDNLQFHTARALKKIHEETPYTDKRYLRYCAALENAGCSEEQNGQN